MFLLSPQRALATIILTGGLLFTSTSCTTVTSKSGEVDTEKRPGQVRGQIYYLPKAQVRVLGTVDKAAVNQITVAITVTYVPDTRFRYYLDPTTNLFYDDDYKLHVDSSGLLETVNMVAEDKTGAILGDLAKIAAHAAKFSAGIAPTGRSKALGAMEAVEPPEPFDYTFFLDEVDRIKPLIRKRGFELDVALDPVEGAQFRSLRNASSSTRQTEAGVVFRPAIPCRITVTDEPFRFRLAKYEKWAEHYSSHSAAVGRLTTNETRIAELRRQLKSADARETELIQNIERRSKEQGRPDPDMLLTKYQTELVQVQKDLRSISSKLTDAEALSEQLAQDVQTSEKPSKLAEAAYRSEYIVNSPDYKGEAMSVGDGALRARMVVPVPDEDTQLLMRMGRTPFVKRTDNIVFAKGLLTKVEGIRPSPILGFLQIPKTILETIAPLPLELRQTRVNNINQQRTLDDLLAPVESTVPTSGQ